MKDEVSVVIRSFNPEMDQACVYSTWRNSAYYGVPHRTNPAKPFFKQMTRFIAETLLSATVRVACLEDDPRTIVGYSVSTGNHLDWIYVKVDFRGKGIGTLLVPKNIETYTDRITKIGEKIVEKKNLKLKGERHGTGEEGTEEEFED